MFLGWCIYYTTYLYHLHVTIPYDEAALEPALADEAHCVVDLYVPPHHSPQGHVHPLLLAEPEGDGDDDAAHGLVRPAQQLGAVDHRQKVAHLREPRVTPVDEVSGTDLIIVTQRSHPSRAR